MSKYKIKTWLIGFGIVIITLFLARPLLEKGFNWLPPVGKTYTIDIVDDSGFRIRLERPADRIISLYSAHTENLFSLGLDREIIGVGTSAIYPYQARSKEVFDYRSDPEKVIAANPQIVIIRPFVERHSPDFVSSLKRAGITVVSLYPDNFDEFDDYIMKLATLTGKRPRAEQLLADFHAELAALQQQTAHIDSPVGVYFESSDIEYKTVTPLSMAAHAIEYAGGRNVASDAVPIEVGSSIAVYGTENIIKKAAEIDVYVTQRGVMGAGGNYHSISIRPGFDVIKAIRDRRVVEINQKIISSPTFRFIKGVKALQRAFYPEIFCKVDFASQQGEITRAELAEVLVKQMEQMIFVPTRSYYRDDNREHYYGNFSDVTVDHPRFDFVETAIKKSYFKTDLVDDEEFFYPDRPVTRYQFARILYLINDLPIKSVEIDDIAEIDNHRLIEAVVSAGLMTLEDGKFYPDQFIDWRDVEKGLTNDQHRVVD